MKQGERLRMARQSEGLTQKQAAEACGTTQSHWSNYERGSEQLSLDRLFEIAQAIGINPHKLDPRLVDRPRK